MISLAYSLQSPFVVEVDVGRPIHATLREIEHQVIGFMKFAATIREHGVELPPGADAHMTHSYPIILVAGLTLEVKHPRVTVSETGGRGRGVVATADIPANSIVTFYPSDLIRIRCHDGTQANAGNCLLVTAHEHLREPRAEGVPSHTQRLDDYKFTIGNVDVYADPNTHTSGSCGHLVNDGNGPVQGTNNSVLVPLFGGAVVAVVAVFEIKKGCEVLAWYGMDYWHKRSTPSTMSTKVAVSTEEQVLT